MALGVTEIKRGVFGDLRYAILSIDFDSSYPTGGEAVSNTTLGFGEDVYFMALENKSGYVFEWDDTNSKVLAFYGDYSESADGALVQVADTTNLSAVTGVRLFAVGK